MRADARQLSVAILKVALQSYLVQQIQRVAVFHRADYFILDDADW